LKLRLVKSHKFSLQLPNTLSTGDNVSNQGQAQFSVGSDLLGLIQLRRPRERYPEGVPGDQSAWRLSRQRRRCMLGSLATGTEEESHCSQLPGNQERFAPKRPSPLSCGPRRHKAVHGICPTFRYSAFVHLFNLDRFCLKGCLNYSTPGQSPLTPTSLGINLAAVENVCLDKFGHALLGHPEPGVFVPCPAPRGALSLNSEVAAADPGTPISNSHPGTNKGLFSPGKTFSVKNAL